MLLTHLSPAWCSGIDAPNFGHAMVSFYGGPTASIDGLLSNLSHLGVSAAFFLDPHDEDFNESLVCDIINRRHVVGIAIPSIISKMKNLQSKLERSIEKFKSCTRIDPKIVMFEEVDVTPQMKKAAAECGLTVCIPSMRVAKDERNFSSLSEAIDGLDSSKGRISLSLPEDTSPQTVSCILNRIRTKFYNFIHPETYLKVKLTPKLRKATRDVVNPPTEDQSGEDDEEKPEVFIQTVSKDDKKEKDTKASGKEAKQAEDNKEDAQNDKPSKENEEKEKVADDKQDKKPNKKGKGKKNSCEDVLSGISAILPILFLIL